MRWVLEQLCLGPPKHCRTFVYDAVPGPLPWTIQHCSGMESTLDLRRAAPATPCTSRYSRSSAALVLCLPFAFSFRTHRLPYFRAVCFALFCPFSCLVGRWQFVPRRHEHFCANAGIHAYCRDQNISLREELEEENHRGPIWDLFFF